MAGVYGREVPAIHHSSLEEREKIFFFVTSLATFVAFEFHQNPILICSHKQIFFYETQDRSTESENDFAIWGGSSERSPGKAPGLMFLLQIIKRTPVAADGATRPGRSDTPRESVYQQVFSSAVSFPDFPRSLSFEKDFPVLSGLTPASARPRLPRPVRPQTLTPWLNSLFLFHPLEPPFLSRPAS